MIDALTCLLREHAHRTGKSIAAIDLGQTQADRLFQLKLERLWAEVRVTLAQILGAGRT